MKLYLLIPLWLVSACAADAPPGTLERMRAQVPAVQDPPTSYNEKGIGVP